MCFVLGAGPAEARCVRELAESGAVLVRCADGVRGRLASDEVARPAAPVITRPSHAKPGPLAYSSPGASVETQSLLPPTNPDGSPRVEDPVAGALSRTRAFGAATGRKSFP